MERRSFQLGKPPPAIVRRGLHRISVKYELIPGYHMRLQRCAVSFRSLMMENVCLKIPLLIATQIAGLPGLRARAKPYPVVETALHQESETQEPHLHAPGRC